MKKARTIAAVFNNAIGGIILGVLIAGIASIVYTIDNSDN